MALRFTTMRTSRSTPTLLHISYRKASCRYLRGGVFQADKPRNYIVRLTDSPHISPTITPPKHPYSGLSVQNFTPFDFLGLAGP